MFTFLCSLCSSKLSFLFSYRISTCRKVCHIGRRGAYWCNSLYLWSQEFNCYYCYYYFVIRFITFSVSVSETTFRKILILGIVFGIFFKKTGIFGGGGRKGLKIHFGCNLEKFFRISFHLLNIPGTRKFVKMSPNGTMKYDRK